jgi:hypothetical protein
MNPEYKIKNVTHCESQRNQLVQFLATFEDEARSEDFWHERLVYWWDINPFYKEDMPKGWILTYQGNIVGFLGVIAFEYIYQGDVYQALAATTWRVLIEHRKYSLRLFSEYQSCKDKYILLNTTPNQVVKKVLTTYKYNLINEVHNHYFLIKQYAPSLTNLLFNMVYFLQNIFLKENNLKFVKLGDSFHTGKQLFPIESLQKNISRDYISWYCHSPSLKKEFIGCVRDNNILSSYLILKRGKVKGFDTLQIIDYYTSHSDNSELLALVQYVCEHPDIICISQGCKLLILSSFATNRLFEKIPPFIISKGAIYPHYYFTPSALNGAHKMCHIAEGDYGL